VTAKNRDSSASEAVASRTAIVKMM
jgi:hypothetical protein